MIANLKNSRTWLYILAGLVALILIYFSGQLIATGNFKLVIFPIFILGYVIAVLVYPQIGLVTIILAVFSMEFLAGKGWMPQEALWTVDGLVGLLFVRLLIENEHTLGYFLRSFEFKILLVWVGLLIISAVANNISVLQTLLGLRVYIRFVFLYYCLLEFEWEPVFLERCIKLIAWLCVLQIPVTIYQKFSGTGIDAVFGTISNTGATGDLGLLAMVAFAGLAAYGIFSKKKLPLILGFAVLILPIMATARAFIFIMPLVVIYTFLRVQRFRVTWQLGLVILLVGLLIINWDKLQGVSSFQNFTPLDAFRNPTLLFDELNSGPASGTQGATIGRFEGLKLAYDRIAQTSSTLLFGYGPAAAQGSRFDLVQMALFLDLASSGGRASQITRSLLEWGVLGTLAYALVYVILLWKGEKYYRVLKDPFWKAVAFGNTILLILAITLVFYSTPWSTTVISFLVFFMGGALHRVVEEQEASSL